jgi:hypothetical protein
MSLYEQALREAARQVQAIGTDRFVSDELEVRELDWDDVVTVGGVTIRYDFNQIRERQEGTNERDIYGYPAFLCIAQGWNKRLEDDGPPIGDFIHKVTAYFHNRRRMGKLEIDNVNELPCVVTPGPQPPKNYRDKKIITRTIWMWFLVPRSDDNFV